MKRIAKFEKVTKERFLTDAESLGATDKTYDEIIMPSRATTGSAGYDFRTPLDLTLKCG